MCESRVLFFPLISVNNVTISPPTLFYIIERSKKGAERNDRMTDNELKSDVDKYRPMLFRLAYSCTGDISVCDDIVQEAFLKLYSCNQKFSNEEGKKAWLIRVTINNSRNYRKAWWNRSRNDLPENSIKEDNPDDEIIALKAALGSLKPAYRQVIFLHYYEGYTAAEIGKLLNLSLTAVTTRLQRGREMLRKYLD